jgi:hypothetical protein
MTRSDREKQLEAMNHSPVGFAEVHRISGSAMVVEILNDEFPRG